MGAHVEECMRLLARHQWVREHGTPRVTTLSGRGGAGRGAWTEWLRLTGRARQRQTLFAQPARADASWLERTAPKVAALATAEPRVPVAIAVDAALLARWLGARDDRLGALIAEGIVPVAARRRAAAAAPANDRLRAERARSLAELALYDALEATPSTAGRFALNQAVSFTFGSRAAEVDLLSRGDELAIEIDGYHHFTDADGYRRDRQKDLLLQAHGHVVLRFLADDVLADPRPAVNAVVEVLGRRLARARRSR